MRKMLKWLIAIGIILNFLSSPVQGGWKQTVTNNQLKATEYINQLKTGADPNSLTRPTLRRKNNFRAKRSQQEINKAMDDAEALARAGKPDLIKVPEFAYKGVSEDKATK
jgi:hypothetical protein